MGKDRNRVTIENNRLRRQINLVHNALNVSNARLGAAWKIAEKLSEHICQECEHEQGSEACEGTKCAVHKAIDETRDDLGDA